MDKVEQFYNKNQFLIKSDNGVTFQSYSSTIATINNDGVLKLYNDWDYSKTTLKHLYLFLFDYLYLLNQKTRELIQGLQYSKNKRKEIQKLIDTKQIKYWC